MNHIRRFCRSLADLTRRAGVLFAGGVARPAGKPAAAATWLEQAPTAARPPPPGDQQRPVRLVGHPDRGHGHAARPAAGGDGTPDAGAAARARQHRRNDPVPVTASGMLPRTIQLCAHCQQRPAGFWVRRTGGTVVRRPWCLSCCQDLDRDHHDVIPFGG